MVKHLKTMQPKTIISRFRSEGLFIPSPNDSLWTFLLFQAFELLPLHLLLHHDLRQCPELTVIIGKGTTKREGSRVAKFSRNFQFRELEKFTLPSRKSQIDNTPWKYQKNGLKSLFILELASRKFTNAVPTLEKRRRAGNMWKQT